MNPSYYYSLFIIITLLINTNNATNQATNLHNLLKSKRLKQHDPSLASSSSWATLLPDRVEGGPVHVALQDQDGLKEADMLSSLPGQPGSVEFNQYAGYVSLGPASDDKALFYYFAESPHNSSTKPLVLWLNGGPGCSSFGNGGMLELGPFRVKSDGKTLYTNPYAWNNVANVIFLESPAGVGYSYGNESTVYQQTGDMSTAKDAYTFLVNWLERFPEYKTRDFYLTGESYAGHYVPQLAYTILQNNVKYPNLTHINLKGIAIGNAWIDDATNTAGMYDYFWTHAMYSDETHTKIDKYCNYSETVLSQDCYNALDQASEEVGDNIDVYNIYAPVCLSPGHQQVHILDSADLVDPCASNYVETYLNSEEVQKALHVKPTKWASCSAFDWQDSPNTVLPVIQKLMASNISVWIYSGDVDGRVPVTSSKYSINALKLPINTSWRPWYSDRQVGGYVVGYEGLIFVTVRGAGHMVPSYQPQTSLTMISSFLHGILPPKA